MCANNKMQEVWALFFKTAPDMNVTRRREEVSLQLRKDRLQEVMMKRRYINLSSQDEDFISYELNEHSIQVDPDFLKNYQSAVHPQFKLDRLISSRLCYPCSTRTMNR